MNDLEEVRSLLGNKVKVKTEIRTFKRVLKEDQEGFYTLDRSEKCYLTFKVYRVDGYKPVIEFNASYWIKK